MGGNIIISIESVKSAFNSRNLKVQDEALPLCTEICQEFNIPPDMLAEQWDLISMNNNLTGPADYKSINKLRSSFTKDLRPAKSENPSQSIERTPVSKRRVSQMSKTLSKESLGAVYGVQLAKSPQRKAEHNFSSPIAQKRSKKGQALFSPASFQSPPSNTYETRTNAGQCIEKYNSSILSQTNQIEEFSNNSKVYIEFPVDGVNTSSDFSFMYTPLVDRSQALDDQLIEAQNHIGDVQKITEFGIIGDPSPAQVTVVGRICCEAAEGKLNPNVIMLEGSQKHCGGQRIKLDLSGVASYSLFPGMIVALQGILNSVRSPMIVKHIVEPCPSPMMKIPKKSFEKSIKSFRGEAKVMVGCGPFTVSTDIEYLPLNDLVEAARVEKPNIIILVGPFIDSTHPAFKDGTVVYDDMIVSFQDIFLFKVVAVLDKLMGENENLQVVLVPSLKDANHPYVYPQPPFDKSKVLEICQAPRCKERLHLLSNPATFSINNVLFGVSAIDTLLHLGSSEIHRASGDSKSRLVRLAEHMVNQRSFYPIFPPPPSGEAPLDAKFMKQYQFKVTPDILILPSMLNRFCGNIGSSLYINCGSLAKGQSGGTYALLRIFPPKENSTDEFVLNNIQSRTYVEIKRI